MGRATLSTGPRLSVSQSDRQLAICVHAAHPDTQQRVGVAWEGKTTFSARTSLVLSAEYDRSLVGPLAVTDRSRVMQSRCMVARQVGGFRGPATKTG